MSVPVGRYAALVILGLALVACRTHRSTADNVTKELQSGATQVDIGRAADFAWDSMFVFGPYYPKAEICKTLRLTDSQCSSAGIKDVDEGEFLIVFLERGAVSKTESFPRKISNFDESCLTKPIVRNSATFAVERRPEVYLVCPR